MGRPIQSKYFGPIPSTTNTKHLYFSSAWVPGAAAQAENSVYIVEQTGTGRYKATDGVNVGTIALVNAVDIGIPAEDITSYIIVSPGTGYIVGNLLSFVGGTFTNAALATVTAIGAISATDSAAGTGYDVGDTLTLVGGTYGTAATFTVETLTGGPGSGVATVALASRGTYSVLPSTGAPNVGPAPVPLLTSAQYVILAESGITAGAGSNVITGNIAVSPIAATAITGFALTLNGPGTFATSAQVTGDVYAASYNAPTPALLTQAVSDMQAAYTAAAAYPTGSGHLNLGAGGNIDGLTFVPGVYTWTINVTTGTSLGFTLAGGPNDVFIFQISGTLSTGVSSTVTLTGGVNPANVYWQVAGAVTLGTTSTFYGNILAQTNIAFGSGITFQGRALAQTAVTLVGSDTITIPISTAATATTTGGSGTGATLNVIFGAIALLNITSSGIYTAFPTNPVSVIGGTGTGATFDLTFSPALYVPFLTPGQGVINVQPFGGGPTEYAAVINQDNVKTFQDHVYEWSTTPAFTTGQANLPLA
jgi:Ice-binding-like